MIFFFQKIEKRNWIVCSFTDTSGITAMQYSCFCYLCNWTFNDKLELLLDLKFSCRAEFLVKTPSNWKRITHRICSQNFPILCQYKWFLQPQKYICINDRRLPLRVRIDETVSGKSRTQIASLNRLAFVTPSAIYCFHSTLIFPWSRKMACVPLCGMLPQCHFVVFAGLLDIIKWTDILNICCAQ